MCSEESINVKYIVMLGYFCPRERLERQDQKVRQDSRDKEERVECLVSRAMKVPLEWMDYMDQLEKRDHL
jgi:hypothetical protein